jgi:RNA polymerase sigma-70 factor (ECF subfamily)
VGSPVAAGKHLLNKSATAEVAGRKARPTAESKKRDDAMFAELIGPSQERVYRLALRITRNTEDAEDVQQETLLKVHRKLGQFEGRSRLTTWISRIAINEALMCLRKRRSAFYMPLEETVQPAEENSASEDFQSPIEGPEAAYSRKEMRELLKQAMERLRPAYRVVFLLRAVEQLSTSETASVLQISASAVKARMRRARSELRDWLEEARSARLHQISGRSLEDVTRQWLI